MAISHRIPGLVLTEHEFRVPLDHAVPDGERITVFAREVAAPDGQHKPFLLFLQGGPGMEATRPAAHPVGPGWLAHALKDHRVLLLDQRGTGRSAPIGTLSGLTAQQQADRLALYRADSIVRDAEWIRQDMGIEAWSVLGQSFGGFCTVTYLSLAPHALRAAYVTGGLPPVGRPVDDMYAATYDRMRERSIAYYERYPEDRDRMRALADRAAGGDVRLPDGNALTPVRLRQFGNLLGMSDGPERLHYLLELPVDSPAFHHDAAALSAFSRNPLYLLVHEACAADGGTTRWSADRLLPADFAADPTLLVGEHMFPSMLDDLQALRPLREAGHLLAAREWPRLYDEAVLATNDVPVAAAVYADDPYVEARFSMETARLIKGAKPWLTNEYLHNGLRADARVLARLMDLAAGRA